MIDARCEVSFCEAPEISESLDVRSPWGLPLGGRIEQTLVAMSQNPDQPPIESTPIEETPTEQPLTGQLAGSVGDAFADIPFNDVAAAVRRWSRLAVDEAQSRSLRTLSRSLLPALTIAAHPDQSLLNVERFLDAVSNRGETLGWLSETPRAIEILVRLFIGSPSLTELLIREPDQLRWLTCHRGLTEFPSREAFIERAEREMQQSRDDNVGLPDSMDALHRYQRRELLRIAACDTFHLVDLKTITCQLSLLADAMIQVVLNHHASEMDLPHDRLAVIAFGKLGGLELNYSSDIDLLFIGLTGSTEESALATKVIRSLANAGAAGFLYRVDTRLRPWGQSGPLVSTHDSYIKYLRSTAALWEKQAILKARVVAGNSQLGAGVLNSAAPLIFNTPVEDIRINVRSMKDRIEQSLDKRGRLEGHVKSGEGGIRDIEFVTQFLQLAYGREAKAVRTPNTTEALLRLFDVGAIDADHYRSLSAGYTFHRVVEHSLQLQDMAARHSLPTDIRSLDHLARRLDFPSGEVFQRHYQGHCKAVRTVFDQVVGDESRETTTPDPEANDPPSSDPSYREAFTAAERRRHRQMFAALSDRLAVVEARKTTEEETRLRSVSVVNSDSDQNHDAFFEVLILGHDIPGDLSIIAGLMQAYGFDVISADAFPADALTRDAADESGVYFAAAPELFVDRFTVRRFFSSPLDPDIWQQFENELCDRLCELRINATEAYAELALRVAESVEAVETASLTEALMPITVTVNDDADPAATILKVRTNDGPGVLFNLSTAMALARLNVRRVVVRTELTTEGREAIDAFHVVGQDGKKLASETILELRAAVVLTTQFTSLLPHSPNPPQALIAFREFLENLFAKPGWMAELASLQDSSVLLALTRLLGVSEFLWDDFLRYQHENLFPVVRDIDGLQHGPTMELLQTQLEADLSEAGGNEELWIDALNRFKDREMLRVDLRQILNVQTAFNTFGRELTMVAEVVVGSTARHFAEQLGVPLDAMAICALGKCGGQEMGFASDIELMFIYDEQRDDIDATRVEKLIHRLQKAIHSQNKGIFAIDLRLRPHGSAGSLAVSLQAFRDYFEFGGPAWPFERQALVKLRPLLVDPASADFAARVVTARDEILYSGGPVDLAAIRAMRERQVRQLVEADTFNAKLSPGGLVDIEYSVQLLQRRFGHTAPTLRTTNTREAIRHLGQLGIISPEDRFVLREAYRFLRRVINGLRMVRGNAKDLTVPAVGSNARRFLVRRLQPHVNPDTFDTDLEHHAAEVIQIVRTLPQRLAENDPGTPSL